jgi:alpha-ribazole phosphatase/probable phosphoglycerate mutase
MTPALWLIRHPEPEASAEGRCYGSLDWDLSETGMRQANAIAAALAAEPLAAIYSSPRRRCVQAAEILAATRSCPLQRSDALRELDFGEFEGRRYDEIAALYPNLYREWMERPTEVEFPGGESFPAMRQRVLQAAADLRTRHAGETIALVTHGGVNRIILAEALGIEPANIFRLAQRYAALNLIRYFGDVPIVELVNAEPRAA